MLTPYGSFRGYRGAAALAWAPLRRADTAGLHGHLLPLGRDIPRDPDRGARDPPVLHRGSALPRRRGTALWLHAPARAGGALYHGGDLRVRALAVRLHADL